MRQDYDSDAEENSSLRGNSTESRRYDDDVLEEEDEREKLLLEAQAQSSSSGRFDSRKRMQDEKRKAAGNPFSTRRRASLDSDEDQELIRDAQQADLKREANRRVRSSFSESPSRWSGEKKVRVQRQNTSGTVLVLRYATILLLIVALFIAIAYGALQASRKPDSNQKLLSNGTSLFAPTTILISLDGFRADFLERELTPTLNSFIQQGVSPRYMTPSFPSVTFPNHFTLVTGLYPESHGVVGNSFWAPEFLETFYYHDSAHSMQPKWWSGEPLWETAELQGVRSAIHMWPGSEAHIGEIEPTYVDVYNGSEVLSAKVDRVLGLLDLAGPKDVAYLASRPRPQLIAAYVPDVDADGHRYGPNSTEIRDTIESVDMMLASLFEGLEQRNLTDIVNVVIVSDHGMATTSIDRLIQLENLIDLDLIDHIEGWPNYGLRPKASVDLHAMYNVLLLQSQMTEGFDVYLRDENMPERYHFSQNERIAPIWIMPHTGWAIVTRADMDVEEAKKKGEVFHPRGVHGYDNDHPLMRAIFMAKGPAFPHEPGSRLDAFQNTEVYNIVCDSLGIEPRPNNGTMRLPLKPVGLHSDGKGSPPEDYDDPPKPQTMPSAATNPFFPEATSFTGSIDTTSSPTTVTFDSEPTALESTAAAPSRPVVNDGGSGNHTAEEDAKAAAQWWAWAQDEYRGFEDWVKGLLDKAGKNETVSQ